MAVDYYLLPKSAVETDPLLARDWLEREARRLDEIPAALDPAAETTKRRLADLLLKLKPEFSEFALGHAEIAEFEKITVEEAHRKYRYIEITGPKMQFTVFDDHVAVSVYSKADVIELDALLAVLCSEGDFVLFDPQTNAVIDVGEKPMG
jgi:hypothetical protein